jgi:hypothetical protein
MAEKTCPHGTPATSFCKACERGDPPPQSVTAADLAAPATAAPPAALSKTEKERLVDLEIVVLGGLKSFVAVGTALLEIRDRRLYRAEHGSFEAYCKAAFGFSRERGRQMIQAAQVATMVGTPNERQARELVPLLDDPPALVEAHAEAAADGPPTAAKIRKAVEKRTPARAEVVPLPEQLRLEFDVDDRVRRWRAAAADAGMDLEEWIAAAADAAAEFVRA